MSLDTSKCLRGFFAIVVVFHHLAQRTQMGELFRYFNRVGFLAVAVFFFLSGYGLQKSYMIKADTYRKSFPAKRLPSILIPYLIMTAIYWCVHAATGSVYSFKAVLLSQVNGTPLADFSWYIENIFLFYIAFWILMCVCRKHYRLMPVGALIWYLLYVFMCVKLNYGIWWFISTQLLIVGMIWAIEEEHILKALEKNVVLISLILLTVLVWIVFLLLFKYEYKLAALISVSNGDTIMKMIMATVFPIGFILLSVKFRIGNPVLRFLGNISLEIYLAQGIPTLLLRSRWIYLSNDLLYAVSVLIITVVLAYGLHQLFGLLLRRTSRQKA